MRSFKILASMASLFFLGCFVVFLVVFVIILHYSIGLPDYKKLEVYQPQITSRLYANDGSLLAEYANEKRIFVPVESIPPLLKNAFIAAEDKNFYHHGGIDAMGIFRAMMSNLRNVGKNKRPEGASTITQQVAKNFLLSSERSLSRKIKEALIARRMEQAFTKDHILELYLNEIYLGMGAYGVASAGLIYFNKSMDELSVAEMAFLAALPKAPNNYNPLKYPEAALARRNWVLSRMAEEGYITPFEAEEAKEEPIRVQHRSQALLQDSGFFAEEVRRTIVKMYGEESIYNGGLSIRTSLDPELQRAARIALQEGLLAYDKKHGWRRAPMSYAKEDGLEGFKKLVIPPYVPETWRYAYVKSVTPGQAELIFQDETAGTLAFEDAKWARPAWDEGKVGPLPTSLKDVLEAGDVIFVEKNAETGRYGLQQYPEVEGALVALDPHTGRVLAMVGGFSFYRNQFNRTVQALRQPGSSFKPFVYLAALDSGYTPSSLILDAPIVMEQPDGTKWKPKNYGNVFYGPTTLRVGLEKSRNLMTLRLAQAIGMDKVVAYGKKFGISDHLEPVLSTAIGAGETTVLRMVSAYGMLVNGGKFIVPSLIDRVQDRDGKTIFKTDQRDCPACSGPESSPDNVPEIPDTRRQIQDPISAYQIVNMLTGVIERGTGRVAKSVGKVMGGKSGTSNDSNDAWFIGFTPDLVAGVWVGYDTPKTLGPNDTGGVVSGPIFRDFMASALKDKPDIPFRVPQGVALVRVNAATGRPAIPGDTDVIFEAFRNKDDALVQGEILGGQDITIKTQEDEPDLGGLY